MAKHVAMDLAKFEVAREVWEAGLSEGSEPCDRVAESMCGKERRGYTLTCLLSLRVLKVPAHAKSFIGAVCNILLSIEPRTRS